LKRVIVLEGAMSSAVFPIVMAKHYGGDTRTAIQVAMGTTFAGLVMIPLWIRLGGQVVGLW
jgi:predicted permease